MKKIMTCLLSMILCCTFLYTPNNTVEAYTADSIENNTIKFLTYEYPFDIKQRVLEFKFVDQGNNTAKLKPYYNGKIIGINEIPEKLALYDDIYFNISNIYGFDDGVFLDRATSMRRIAEYLESLTFTYGVDALRIVKLPSVNIIHFDREGFFSFGYGGNIKGNLGNLNFNIDLTSSDNTTKWRFRVRKDGLYAEYLEQDRLKNGEYYIETVESSNRVLDTLSGWNVGTKNYIPSGNTQTQKVMLEFDEVNHGTTIKFVRNGKYLTWDKANGNNVVASDKMTSGDIGQQYWHLEDNKDGTYGIVSARQITRYLNLDSNNENISVSKKRNDAKQKFRIVKADEKEDMFTSNIKIVSKLNNNKILNVDLGGKTGRELTIWDNANVSQQRFKFEYDEYKNAYRIRDNYYGGYLSCDIDVNSNRVYSSQQLKTASYWALEPTGDGYYYIKNLHNDKVLDIRSDDTHNGNEVIAYKKHGGNNQKFKLVQE